MKGPGEPSEEGGSGCAPAQMMPKRIALQPMERRKATSSAANEKLESNRLVMGM